LKHSTFPKFYLLLVFVPLSATAHWLAYPPWLVFLLSGIAIVPLAAVIADSTEKIAGQVGQSVGGLLNATFGNATEMIVSIVALSEGLVEVVKASISGTIIANLLLALGAGLFFGGLKYREQRFQSRIARIQCLLLESRPGRHSLSHGHRHDLRWPHGLND
jgi:Ca2+:H+ antiporter